MTPIERAGAAEQIANVLRAEIEGGELTPGQLLPPDSELARRFGVSKPTATKARAMLVALGLVSSRAGAASTVRQPPPSTAATGDAPHRATRIRCALPEGRHTTVLSARVVAATPEIAAALRLESGSDVIQRRRITHAADQSPLATSTAYFPADLAEMCPDLLETRRLRQGANRYVEEQTGRIAATVTTAVACAAADRRDADALGLAPGSPVLMLVTTTHDAAGDAFAHEIETHLPGTPLPLEINPI